LTSLRNLFDGRHDLVEILIHFVTCA
jgi:hypothetical protein